MMKEFLPELQKRKDQTVKIGRTTTAKLKDQFAEKNTCYKAAGIDRFVVDVEETFA